MLSPRRSSGVLIWAIVVSSCPGVFGYKLNNVFCGLKHLRTHEYVGRLFVDAVDWTVKGAVTTVKNREQCDSCWALSTTISLKGDGVIVTVNMSPSSEQQLAVTRSIPLVTAGSWTTASTRRFPRSWEEFLQTKCVRMTKFECPSLLKRSRSRCEDQPCVTGDRFVAGFAYQVTVGTGAEVEAFNAYAKWCKDQAQVDGHQQENLDASIASTNAAIKNFSAKAESALSEEEAKDFSKSEAELLDVPLSEQQLVKLYHSRFRLQR